MFIFLDVYFFRYWRAKCSKGLPWKFERTGDALKISSTPGLVYQPWLSFAQTQAAARSEPLATNAIQTERRDTDESLKWRTRPGLWIEGDREAPQAAARPTSKVKIFTNGIWFSRLNGTLQPDKKKYLPWATAEIMGETTGGRMGQGRIKANLLVVSCSDGPVCLTLIGLCTAWGQGEGALNREKHKIEAENRMPGLGWAQEPSCLALSLPEVEGGEVQCGRGRQDRVRLWLVLFLLTTPLVTEAG